MYLADPMGARWLIREGRVEELPRPTACVLLSIMTGFTRGAYRRASRDSQAAPVTTTSDRVPLFGYHSGTDRSLGGSFGEAQSLGLGYGE